MAVAQVGVGGSTAPVGGATPSSGSSASSSLADQHKALISIFVLLAFAFVASAVAGVSQNAKDAIIIMLIIVSVVASYELFYPGNVTNTPLINTIEEYPWPGTPSTGG